MAIKNIEMSVYNGSSYDTLLPVTSDENVTIASAISGLFGLGADSTLTDILQKLSKAVIWDGSSTELPNGSSVVTGARIETGSYVGTGTYGASNPCSLTFEFEPLLFLIFCEHGDNPLGISNFNNMNVFYRSNGLFVTEMQGLNLQENIFTFYNNYSVSEQYNVLDWIYYWFVIG